MQTEEESIIAEIEKLAAMASASQDSISYEQIDNLIARVADLREVGTQLLFNELKSGSMTYYKDGLIVNIFRRLGFRVSKELYPDKHLGKWIIGYWIFDGTNWQHIMPDKIYPEFYLSLQPELEENMTVEEWRIAVENIERERHAEASATTRN